MTEQEFVEIVSQAKRNGKREIRARLSRSCSGVRNVAIRNLDGILNGNPNDLFIQSVSGLRTIGRAYVGSRRLPRELEGWPERIESILDY